MPPPYGKWSIKDLKEELRKRKGKLSGRKKELITRLEFMDQNSISTEPEKEYWMSTPEYLDYKDVHSDITLHKLTPSRVKNYMDIHGAKMSEKISSLYEERFLRFIRGCLWGGNTYLVASVWAEFRKSSEYRVDAKIDCHGIVLEAQCECGAGQGPSAHCKHVCLVLHAYSELCSTGDLLTELTCTQVLQTFHRPKPHKGSPLKSTSLQALRGKRSLKYSATTTVDPQLITKAKNLCINYQATYLEDPPMSYIQSIAPANLYAVATDHDYEKLMLADQYLKDDKLSEITHDEAARIEIQTRDQRISPIWREQRTKRLTSSNFGEICKATERKDLGKLVRRLISPPIITGPALEHGIKYESVAVNLYELKHGVTTTASVLFIDLETPYLAASPDRVIDSSTVLEVKCPYSARDKPITPVTVPYLELRDGELCLKKQHSYYYQVQGQLLCTKRKECHFVVYTFVDQKVLSITEDLPFISQMKCKLSHFYENHFKKELLKKELYKNYDNFAFSY